MELLNQSKRNTYKGRSILALIFEALEDEEIVDEVITPEEFFSCIEEETLRFVVHCRNVTMYFHFVGTIFIRGTAYFVDNSQLFTDDSHS